MLIKEILIIILVGLARGIPPPLATPPPVSTKTSPVPKLTPRGVEQATSPAVAEPSVPAATSPGPAVPGHSHPLGSAAAPAADVKEPVPAHSRGHFLKRLVRRFVRPNVLLLLKRCCALRLLPDHTMTWRSRDLKHVSTPLSFTHDEATSRFALPPNRDIRRTRTVNLSVQHPTSGAVVTSPEAVAKKEQIRQYFHATFEVYERVFEPLAYDEAFWIPPVHNLRHPMIFYLGHTASFYINKLVLAGLTTRINQKFEEMFAIGVDEMSWDDLEERHYDWPPVSEVWEYRRLVRERVDDLFFNATAPPGVPLPLNFKNSTSDDYHAFFWTLLKGIEHERIHLETASVHLRELPLRFVNNTGFWTPNPDRKETDFSSVHSKLNIASHPLVPFKGRDVQMGRKPNDPQFGWDVDYSDGNLTLPCADFQASERLISNAEFYEFMVDGGYQRKELWDDEGWRWVSWKKPQHPWFWVSTSNAPAADHPLPAVPPKSAYRLRVQCEEIDLPWDWPAELNHLEASAYVKWLSVKKGVSVRLPTEAEWLLMWDECIAPTHGDQWKWRSGGGVHGVPGNINLEYFSSSCPVTTHRQGNKLFDVVGNVWQHCDTPNYPYQGYEVHPYYDDFSMPTFDGRHYCMRGGCWVATGNEASRDARFSFRRHFFQCIGMRFIIGTAPTNEAALLANAVIGMDAEVDRAAEESYLVPTESNLAVQAAAAGKAAFDAHFKGPQPSSGKLRALALLCGAGRLGFEVSRHFDTIGVEFSARMLQPAFSLREKGAVLLYVNDPSGKGRVQKNVDAASMGLSEERHRTLFYQADSVNLHAHLTGFDFILSLRAIEKAYDPQAHIPHLITRLNVGGIIVCFSEFAAGAAAAKHNHAFSWDALVATLAAPFASNFSGAITSPAAANIPTVTGKVLSAPAASAVGGLKMAVFQRIA